MNWNDDVANPMLWQPSQQQIDNSQISKFREVVNEKYNLNFYLLNIYLIFFYCNTDFNSMLNNDCYILLFLFDLKYILLKLKNLFFLRRRILLLDYNFLLNV